MSEIDLEYTPITERLIPAYDVRTFPALVGERLDLLEAQVRDLTQRLQAVEEEISYVELELPVG